SMTLVVPRQTASQTHASSSTNSTTVAIVSTRGMARSWQAGGLPAAEQWKQGGAGRRRGVSVQGPHEPGGGHREAPGTPVVGSAHPDAVPPDRQRDQPVVEQDEVPGQAGG